MKVRFAAAAALMLCFALLAGCADPPLTEPVPADATTLATLPDTAEPTATEPAQTSDVTTATDPSETPTTARPTYPIPTLPPIVGSGYNRLTGEYNNPAQADSRAVGVMVGNNSKSRPQTGIWYGDVYLEAETEGGITRIMAVFADASRIPAQLCPVRSARTPFVLMAQAMDLVYVHAGGSAVGLQTVRNTGIHSINALSDNVTFWRDARLKASKGTEYSLCTSGERVADKIRKQGWRTTSDRVPFSFGTPEGGDPCSKLQVTFSGSQTDSFIYDTKTGLYTKCLGSLSKAKTHLDASGNSLQVANVVIMYDTRYAENDTTISFNLTTGEGLLVSGGTVRPVRWARTSAGLSFTENGSPATFLTGKTYICLITAANKGATVIQ